MTPEQQNIAIAEACGWTNTAAPPYQDWQHPTLPGHNTPSGRPAYHSDLNACQEMEKTLTFEEAEEYDVELYALRAYPCFSKSAAESEHAWRSTAPQRCEAFLRVKGLWRDEP